jgi:flagellar biosynthesis/type III secretory pathway M-ring protein FliF/YscJ
MGQLRDIDNRSVIIGLLCGIIVMLVVALGIMRRHQATSALPVQSTEEESKENDAAFTPSTAEMPSYVEQIQLQQQVEQLLEQKVQSLLDDIIGPGRSTVRIHATLIFSREHTEIHTASPGEHRVLLSEETREKSSAESGAEEHAARNYEVNRTIREITGPLGILERLNIALSVDKTKVVWDPDTKVYEEEDRSPEELSRLEGLARQAAGFDEQRGDQIVVYPMVFDKTQDLASRHWFSDVEVFNSLRNKVLRSADLKKLGDRKPPL